jgi:two-component SAPR family response regulator
MHYTSRLLIVDDDPLVLTLLSRLVNAHLAHVHVETTDSPYVALDLIKTYAFDAVISDVHMSGLNGFDLAARVGTISPCTSFVLISGSRDHAERAWSSNIFAYLDKPLDRERFFHIVSQAAEKGRAQWRAAELAELFELTLYAHCYGD